MPGRIWSPEEVEALTEALNETAGDTYTARCQNLAPWRGRSFHAIVSKAQEIGYQAPLRAAKIPDTATRETYVSEITRLQKALEKHEIFTREFEANLKESIGILPALKLPKRIPLSRKQGEPHTALLLIGDVHVGEAFERKDISSMGYAYNFETFCERANLLVEKVKLLTDINRAHGRVDNLVILFLGDIVEGEEIYPGQRNKIDKRVLDQTVLGAEVLAQSVAELSGHFRNVRCLAVWGNHGRMGKDYAEDQNFDRLAYILMKLRLREIKNLKFFTSKSYRMAFELPELEQGGLDNFTWVVWHGDDVRGYMSLPYYDFERTSAKLVQLANIPINYFVIGHHHRHAEIDIPHGRLIINGSWVGTSPFSSSKMKTGSPASQNFYILHPEYGITSSYDIHFTKRWKLEADEEGMFTEYDK